MIFKCACGNMKTGQPYKDAREHKWICDLCRAKQGRNPIINIADARPPAKMEERSLAVDKVQLQRKLNRLKF